MKNPSRVFSGYDEWKDDFLCRTEPRISHAKNNETKVKVVLEYLVLTERKLNIKIQKKSTKKARKYIKEGKKNVKVQIWSDLAETFTKAIMHAKINSIQLNDAYVVRSRALFIGKKYKNAMSDIERVLNMDYSDDMNSSLYSVRTELLHEIEKRRVLENVEALDHAHEGHKKSNDANKSGINDTLTKIPRNSSAVQNTPPVIGVFDAFDVKYSQQSGTYVVARKTIEAGEIMSNYKVYAKVINSEFLHRYCWNCCKQTWAGIACHKCVNVIYCNEACRDRAWQEHHDIECSVISAITLKELSSHDLLALRLTVKAYKETGTWDELQKKIREINKIKNPALKCFTNGVINPARYASVYSLPCNTEDFFRSTERASAILCSLAATTYILGEKIKDLETLSKNKYATFIGGLIKRNFEISLTNSTKLTMDSDIGLVLDSFIPMFKHSPKPTVINFASGGVSTLVAFKKIEKGEQIYLSYDPDLFYDRFGRRVKRLHDLNAIPNL
ncbi:hypothetical protein PV327_001956 [Microctonus hyperodae]|uniref:SET and MYND domain-containing protein 4 n=1 Tax=Microctonus hyperodae TaxID=165561 RepID=A0AA39FEN5_MICHY|nr:hypothetical protein PV327_001956 [Microctonus hyperodae]